MTKVSEAVYYLEEVLKIDAYTSDSLYRTIILFNILHDALDEEISKEVELCCICREAELDEYDNCMSDGQGVCRDCYFKVEDW